MRLVDADNARECYRRRACGQVPGVQVLPRVTYKTAQPAHATVLPDGQARYGVPGQAG